MAPSHHRHVQSSSVLRVSQEHWRVVQDSTNDIMAASSVIRQSKTILAWSCEAGGDEQSGLWTRTATTESVSLCERMKSSARLLNLKRQLSRQCFFLFVRVNGTVFPAAV